MTRDDVEILSNEPLYEGFFRMNLYRLRHRLFAGGWSPVLDREVFERESVAAVVLYDPVPDAVVLLEQFRTGPMAAGDDNPWMIEIVAGIIEGDESPEDLVRREAVEEAGCEIVDLQFVASFYSTPGGASERCTLYCGRVDSDGVGGLHGKHDEGEDIRVFVEPADEAFRRVKDGNVASAFSVIGLQWLELNREDLRRRWS